MLLMLNLPALAGANYSYDELKNKKEYNQVFKGKLKTHIVYIDEKNMNLEVLEYEKSPEGSLPAGTIIKGKILDHRNRRWPSLDEVIAVNLYSYQIPGEIEKNIDNYIKVKPKDTLDIVGDTGNAMFLGTGLVLGITTSVASIALPITRGGLAVWNSFTDWFNASKYDNKWKAAGGGLVRGGLIPVGHLLFKGDYLVVKHNTEIILGRERPNFYVRFKDALGRRFIKDKRKYIHADVIKRHMI